MAKRKSRGAAAESPVSSKQPTPVVSDGSDSDVVSPARKRSRSHSSPAAKVNSKAAQGSLPKSSQELCEVFGLQHVALEYTDADYQNLSNYGLFVRMVRPQVQEPNGPIPSAKMAQVMEAKWREFRENNPFTKKRREEEEKKKEDVKQKELDMKKKEEERRRFKEQRRQQKDDERKKREENKVKEEAEEEEQADQGEENGEEEEGVEEVEEEEEEEEEEVEEVKPKSRRSSTGGLRIKLPITKNNTPKSAQRRQSKRNYVEESEETEEEVSFKKTPVKPSKEEWGDDSEEEEVESPRGRPRRQATKKTQSIYADDINTDESSSDAQPKKKQRKRAPPPKKESSSDEFEDGSKESSSSNDVSEDADDDDDDDSDSQGKRKRKHKKKSGKPQIPGERKSSRKKEKKASISQKQMGMTDREFEKMLALDSWEEKQQDKKKKRTDEEKRKRQKFRQQHGRRGIFAGGQKKPNKGIDEDGNESDHYWYCEVCQDGGDLLLCDKCPRSFHKDCAKLEEVPEGEWACPKCSGDMEKSDEEDLLGHDHYCKICRNGGDVILCDHCPCVFHLKCIGRTDVPQGEWKCPRCICKEIPLKGWVQNILTWKWSKQPKDFDELDHTHSPTKKLTEEMRNEAMKKKAVEEKEKSVKEDKENSDAEKENNNLPPERMLFIKFRDYSYWECDWITELQLEMFHTIMWSNFKRKWDQDEPPALEDGSSYGRRRHLPGEDKVDDPHNLEERFYKWSVKPEWLQIERIINHDKQKNYLVKWQDLPYENCTWERATNIQDGCMDWHKHVAKYYARKKEHAQRWEDKKHKDRPKKATLKKKVDAQPGYIESTGGKLHPYQLEGFNWLRFSWAQDTNTILADEMGLGKTIQAIAFLFSLWKENYLRGPFLLSVPLSTILNWEREFNFWAPDLYVVTYIGARENRAIIREHEFCYKEGAFHAFAKPSRMKDGYIPKFDVLLTSYEFVHMDITTLSSIPWDILVIDEAHRLKSQQSLFFRTLTTYRIGYKLLLTGTPLQNNLEELFNLLSFLEPDKFNSLEDFLGNFSEISKDEQVQRLHQMLAPHMLRRLKIDVLKDLPSKNELLIRVELSDMQKKYYKNILAKNYEALNVKGHSNQTSLMNIMMDLRKCCNHPYLFPTAETEAPVTPRGYFEGTALIKASGKLQILSKMLHQLREEGHRTLIFSQMTRVLDILEEFLVHENIGYERIDGSVMGKLRQEAIDRFNSLHSNSFVFLLSTRAGGLGINLATADTVIIYDVDWNPHNDIQAFSRAHRIGQKNKVLIYRFVSRNTVEERMTQVAKKKMMLTELVIHRGMCSEKVESITKQEVNDILKFGAEELFKDDDDSKKLTYDDETIKKLLDRSQEGEEIKEKEFGMNEYLRSFKVATYDVKETEEEEPEEEEEETPQESDAAYWKRLLGSAYEEHQLQMLQEQEAIAAKLGKGKRIRTRVNYAEALMEKAAVEQAKLKEEKKKGKANKAMLLEADDLEDEPEDTREDIVYMSDYEPDSSQSSDSSGDEELAGSDTEVVQTKPSKQAGRPKIEQSVKERKREEMPPLLAKVNGQVEVLGFTPRQRRAFLDAIMRYGLPPEDTYKSQWLVRDLRRKSEKIFKAYVALFMRHLCEPINEEAEKFADGVPREGLSRQHILTRIGMMALIRKKVHEFEKANGVDSLSEFGMRVIVGAKNSAASVAPVETPDKKKNGSKGDKDKKTEEKKDKEKNGEKEKEGKKEDETSKEKSDEKKKKKLEESDGTEKEVSKEKEPPEKDGVKEESSKDGDATVKEEVEDARDKSNKTESESKGESKSKEGEKEAEVKTENEIKEEPRDSETGENEKKETDKSDEKETEKDGEKSSKKKEVKQEEVSMELDGEKKSEDKDKEETDKEGDESKEKTKDEKEKSEKSKDGEEEKEKAKSKDGEEEKEMAKSKDGEEEKEKDDGTDKDDKADKKPSAGKSKDTPVKKVIDERVARAKKLRQRLYVADGGFTDIQNLWAYEENLLRSGEPEYEIWHRRHDFWLLTGIITHGYRHWQDILNDPRFEIMNKAFRNDADKMRKGAFLNRRFQLLEQALVIEEQLKRELRENDNLQKMLPAVAEDADKFTQVDQLAEILRRLIRDGHIPAGTDPSLIKLLMQIENLVGDIRQATYTGMPATIAKSQQGVVSRGQIGRGQQGPAATTAPQRGTPKGGGVIMID